MKYLKYLAVSLIAIPVPAFAEEGRDIVLADRPRDELITVVATGLEEPAFDLGQSISIVGTDEIEAVQGPDMTRVLERLPGVTFSRNGGLGSFTGLRVRGANAEQLLVLVDGIRVADAAAPGGGYDLGNLATGPIGKIELLRGSNSVIWGSDAIGGVLAMTTKEVDGVEAKLEYGARDTVNADASAGLSGNDYAVTLSGGHTETDGFSQSAAGVEPDGFRQWRLGGKGRLGVAQGLSLVAAGRYADSRLEFDGFSFDPPYGLIDTPEYGRTEEIAARGGLEYRSSALSLDAGYAIYDITRDNYDPRFGTDPGFASKGWQRRVEAKGRWDATDAVRLDFGADHEWSRFETSYDEPAKANATSGHALLGRYGERFAFAVGARIDDHSDFGSEWTFGANGSVVLGQGWRLRASYGEGFKVPTLYQLHSDFGNGALRPERSKSYDAGLELGDRNDDLHVALTVFRRDTRGLIDFVSCFSVGDPLCADGRFGFYANVGKARAEGVELEMGARLGETFRAQAAYSYVKPTNRTPGDVNRGNDLARRPRHAVTVALDWETPLAGLKLGADLRFVSESYDDAGNFTRLEPYALGTLRARLPVSEAIELYGRIENVTDETYQTVAGYGTPGRSAYLGARARF